MGDLSNKLMAFARAQFPANPDHAELPAQQQELRAIALEVAAVEARVPAAMAATPQDAMAEAHRMLTTDGRLDAIHRAQALMDWAKAKVADPRLSEPRR